MQSKTKEAIASILTALVELDGEAPSGHLYMGLHSANAERYTHAVYMAAIGAMIRSDLVTEEHDVIAFTPKGRSLAERIEAAIAEGA